MHINLTPRLRLAVLMTLAVYPIVTLYLYILAAVSQDWTVWQRTLVLVPVMVATIVFFLTPLIQRYFGKFIAAGAAGATGSTGAAGRAGVRS